jgi:hypothetical protein
LSVHGIRNTSHPQGPSEVVQGEVELGIPEMRESETRISSVQIISSKTVAFTPDVMEMAARDIT